jgi:uncharacterized membrane protein
LFSITQFPVGSTSHLQNPLLQTIRALASTIKIHINLLDIKIILDTHVLKRWTKEANSGQILNTKTENVQEDVNLIVTQQYRRLCPRAVKLVTKSSDNEEAYAFVERMIKEMEKHVQNIKKMFKYYS